MAISQRNVSEPSFQCTTSQQFRQSTQQGKIGPAQEMYLHGKPALYLLLLDKEVSAEYEYRNCVEKIAILLDPVWALFLQTSDNPAAEGRQILGNDLMTVSEDNVLVERETVQNAPDSVVDRLLGKISGQISSAQKKTLQEMKRRDPRGGDNAGTDDDAGAERQFLEYATYLRAQSDAALARRGSGPSWAPSIADSMQDYVMLEPAEILKHLNRETGIRDAVLSLLF